MARSYTAFVTVGALLALVSATPGTAAAYSFLQTPNGSPLVWTTTPVEYWIGPLSDDLPEAAQIEAIQASFEAWESIDGVEVTFLYMGRSDIATAAHDGYNVVYFQQSGWPQGSAAIATTQSYATEDGAMVGFDLRINDANYQFTASDVPEDTNTDLQNCITHEVGHVLGLDHSLDSEATMYAVTSSGDLEKRTLAPDDMNGALFLYGDGSIVAEEGDALVGCSTAPGAGGRAGAGLGAMAIAAITLLRRRRG